MSSIKWNGNKLEDFGVIVEKIPPFLKAKKRFKTYTIPGRDGILWVDENTLEPITLQLECHYNEDVADRDTLNKIFNTDGRLTLDGIRYYDGFINNNIDYDKVQNFRKFLLNFTLNPVAHEIAETTFTYDSTAQSNQILFDNNEYTTYPIIEINGTGQLIVVVEHETNISESFTIMADGNGAYKLDCEAKEIVRNNVNCSNIMSGVFPVLRPTINDIYVSGTGTLTSLTIKYHRAFY